MNVSNPKYMFRLRFRLATSSRLNFETGSVVLLGTETEHVSLRAASSGSIKDTRELVVRGTQYKTESEARARGLEFQYAVVVALALVRVGADFGFSAPGSWVNTEYFSKKTGERVEQDKVGLAVYELDPPPRFIMVGSPDIIVGKNGEEFLQRFRTSWMEKAVLTERKLIAFHLFSASCSQNEIETRFLLLMMAIETLLEQRARSEEVCQHVESLLKATQDNDVLADQDKQSLITAIEALRQESVGQAGRRVAEQLSGSCYADHSPKAFFNKCYGLRSRLVHGVVPRPSHSELNGLITELERFVVDLLSLPE